MILRSTAYYRVRSYAVKAIHWKVVGLLFTSAVLTVPGCGDGFANLTAPLGGDMAGERGTVRVVFINNTPRRAVLTFGSYDPADRFSDPDFGQFSLDDSGAILDGNGTSAVISIECARAFGVGSPKLLELIEANLPGATLDEEALIEGVKFYDVSSDDNAGSAPPLEALLGVDFPCNALLIIRLEFDDLGPDPFRVDFELIPSESTR